MRPHVPEDRWLFIERLARLKQLSEVVYILGDLFEYWYSGLEEGLDDVLNALNDPAVRVMYGNRDFLLAGSPLIPGLIGSEELVLDLYGRRTLIAHGHLLMQDDLGFKTLHALGWPLLRALDKRLPQAWKRSWAESLVRSSAAVRPPSGVIAPGTALRKGVDTVICGHLHRGVLSPDLIVVPAFVDAPVYLGVDERGAAFYSLD